MQRALPRAQGWLEHARTLLRCLRTSADLYRVWKFCFPNKASCDEMMDAISRLARTCLPYDRVPAPPPIDYYVVNPPERPIFQKTQNLVDRAKMSARKVMDTRKNVIDFLNELPQVRQADPVIEEDDRPLTASQSRQIAPKITRDNTVQRRALVDKLIEYQNRPAAVAQSSPSTQTREAEPTPPKRNSPQRELPPIVESPKRDLPQPKQSDPKQSVEAEVKSDSPKPKLPPLPSADRARLQQLMRIHSNVEHPQPTSTLSQESQSEVPVSPGTKMPQLPPRKKSPVLPNASKTPPRPIPAPPRRITSSSLTPPAQADENSLRKTMSSVLAIEHAAPAENRLSSDQAIEPVSELQSEPVKQSAPSSPSIINSSAPSSPSIINSSAPSSPSIINSSGSNFLVRSDSRASRAEALVIDQFNTLDWSTKLVSSARNYFSTRVKKRFQDEWYDVKPVELDHKLQREAIDEMVLKLLEMSTRNHSNLSRFVGFTSNANELYSMWASVEIAGTLRDLPFLSQERRFSLAIQLTSAITFLHENHFLHGQLTPNNVAMKKDTGALTVQNYFLPICGLIVNDARPSRWTAPEVAAGALPSKAADVYSLGALIYDLFSSLPQSETGSLLFEPFSVPQELRALLARSLSTSPTERPEAAELLSHLRALLNRAKLHQSVSEDELRNDVFALKESTVCFQSSQMRPVLPVGERVPLNAQVLSLVGNDFSTLDAGVYNLQLMTDVHELDISSCNLEEIPFSIFALRKLSSLRACQNRLRLISGLERLPELAFADFSGNPLALFELGRGRVLSALHTLTLSDCNMSFATSWPQLIKLIQQGVFANLQTLDLSRNPLTHWPDTLAGSLPRLRSFTASNCNLRTLPNLSACTQLQTLELEFNNIVGVQQLAGMESLCTLNLSSNPIVEMPDLSALRNLLRLNLRDTNITALPPSIGTLTQLKRLDLRNCQLNTHLPPSLADLTNLQNLMLSGNKLATIPAEIVASWSSVTDTLAYLRDLSQTRIPWRRIKLLVVGEEGVGKTSVLRTLAAIGGKRKKKIKRAPETVSTDGISISSWQPEDDSASSSSSSSSSNGSSESDGVQFSVYDFGGQQIFYPTHSFFLTGRSIYIICFSLAKTDVNASLARVEYWAKQVKAKAGTPRVVVVGTHLDDKTAQKNVPLYKERLESLVRRFSFIRACHLVSCRNGNGVPALSKELIELARSLGILKEEIPKSWQVLEQAILAKRASRISILEGEAFHELCRDVGISEQSIALASSFLTDIGTIITHGNRRAPSSNIVVLDPQWLADVFSSIISFKQGWVKNGLLAHSDLRHIWSAYSPNIYKHLISILERFEVLYDVKINNTPYLIVPSLVQSRVPPEAVFAFPETVALTARAFKRHYVFEFAPLGFFARLMVRLHAIANLSIEHLWSAGFVGRTSRDEQLALSFDDVAYRLAIEVRVRQPLDTSPLLRHAVEIVESVIEDYYATVHITRQIPCPQCNRHMFAVENLQELIESAGFDDASDVATVLRTQCASCGTAHALNTLAPDLLLSDITLISHGRLNIERELAKGGFGVVYKGTLDGTIPVAIKRVGVDNTTSNAEGDVAQLLVVSRAEIYRDFQKEASLMSLLNCANLVQFYGICLRPVQIVMEFVDGGDLFHYLAETANEPPSWEVRLKLALDIANGMLHLHQLNPPIVHRDLRSPNVFLARNGDSICAKVADFGLSRALGPGLRTPSQSWQWLAPELLDMGGDQKCTLKADVYAFAMVCIEIITHRLPFDEYFEAGVNCRRAILEEGLRPTLPPDTPPAFKMLLRQCWHSDAEKRPAFAEITHALRRIAGLDVQSVIGSGAGAGASSRLGESQANLFFKHYFSDSHDGGVSAITYAASSGYVWTATRHGTMYVWDSRNKFALVHSFQAHPQKIYGCCAVKNQVWSTSEQTILVWSKKFKLKRNMPKHSVLIRCIISLPDHSVYTGDVSGMLVHWEENSTKSKTKSFINGMRGTGRKTTEIQLEYEFEFTFPVDLTLIQRLDLCDANARQHALGCSERAHLLDFAQRQRRRSQHFDKPLQRAEWHGVDQQ
jgi:serine/threonine protein kinase/GTPase SAR1 family protein